MYESEGGDYLASIKEVAQKAGVGVGTVSRVLNSTGYVSDETRIKVETAMKELNYIPNELARNLLSKRNRITQGVFIIILNMRRFKMSQLYSFRNLLWPSLPDCI